MKRSTIIISLVAISSMLLSACAGSNQGVKPENDQKEEKVHLVIWDWLSGDRTQGPGLHFEEIDKLYMAQNPNVTIERVAQPADKYYDILKPALLAQTGPDIYLMHDTRPVEYHEFSLPLNNVMSTETQENLVGLNVFTVDNDLLAYPIGIQGNIWYYNKQKFAEAGLDPEKTPTSWEELTTMMDTLKGAGITPVAVGDKEGEFIGNWAFSMNLASQLSREEIEALIAGEMSWEDPRIKQAYALAAELYLNEYSQPTALTTAIYPDNGELFKRGEAALTIGLLADVLNWKEFGDALGLDNVGIFINPAPEGAAYPDTLFADPGVGFAINKNTKSAQAAADYLSYVTNGDNLGKYFNATGTLPNNKTTDTSIINNALAQEVFVMATSSNRSIQTVGKVPVAMKEAIIQGSHKVLFNKQSVDEFLKELEAAK